ncbi:MAG: pirin family protein [bacterium]
MITLRPSAERGRADHGWLQSRHSFSFADYHDPRHMGFRHLRVINEDRVAPGRGFGTHPHHDMEIISYVLDGAMEHRDSLGNGSIIRPGEVQRMTAGTGVTHSEFNHSRSDPLHFLQIWIIPERRGLTPGYEQKRFDLDADRGRLHLVASPDRLLKKAGPSTVPDRGSSSRRASAGIPEGLSSLRNAELDPRDGAVRREGAFQQPARGGDAVRLHQDVALYAARLDPGDVIQHRFSAGRHGWLQLIDGALTANDLPLAAGDGAAISQEEHLRLEAKAPAHLLLFDLA